MKTDTSDVQTVIHQQVLAAREGREPRVAARLASGWVLFGETMGPLHGYGIAQQIEALSEDALRVEQGSLYPALERLQKKGWITSKWGDSPTGRRARYYTLTAAGRRQLGNEISSFDAMLVAINRVLRRA